MKIGLDLDGTVYSHPQFFAAMIVAMHAQGHEFFCISSHGRWEWDATDREPECVTGTNDVKRLSAVGIPAHLIDPRLMHVERHGHLSIKGQAADNCDFVFDDDVRLQQYTRTPVFSPLK